MVFLSNLDLALSNLGDSGAVQERNDGSGRNSRIGEKDSKNDSWEDLSEEQQSTSAL